MHIGFGIILPREPQNFIRKAQLELHHRLSILPGRQLPHITFKSPFKAQEIEGFVAYFDQLAKTTKPFPVTLDGIGSFGTGVLFLDVAENAELEALHKKVLNDLQAEFTIEPDPGEGENVHFHATICKPQTPDVFEEARSYLLTETPAFTFEANEIGIYYHLGGDHSWIVYHQMPLLG